MDTRRDVEALPQKYQDLHHALSSVVPADRLVTDPLRTLAFGTDASFYRLVPRIVVRVRSTDEVARVLREASRLDLGCTFRAGGTSLSGQSVSDSVLVQVTGGFRRAEVKDGGERIALEPGVIGAEANALLAPLGRKIGPDPASIGAAMVGGIAANNASGMCCGTSQNSYQTVESAKILLADGTALDTADAASRAAFARSHAALLEGLADLRAKILADPPLAERIRRKYRIKNTTGYGLNSFVDFEDPFDILLHLLIGSEGTLAFISEITYRTVEEHAHKASALLFFPDLDHAARATQALKAGNVVSAAELMDRPSLRSVENKAGLPPILRTLPADACALLVEVRAADPAALAAKVEAAKGLIAGIATLAPVAFTAVKAEYETLWDVRKGLFPAVGGARRVGTTVVIEDVAFPIEHLAAATVELQGLFLAHGYSEGIIFGHALDGNVHFVFTQDFGDRAEVERYERFMQAVCDMVVRKYGGSLKAEHGTGRNMAPFVALEWGEKGHAVMRRVKQLFDPKGILNPGVILNDDPRAHLANLKPLPATHDLVDKCIECGFCEPKCASRALTLTPRQRITLQREIARLRTTGADPQRLARLEADFQYQGLDTCAADGLCATACPVSIDTGKLTKALRAEERGGFAKSLAGLVASHYEGAIATARAGFAFADAQHAVLGSKLLGAITGTAHRATTAAPAWNPHFPRPARIGQLADVVKGEGRQVIYFPSCITRMWGPARGDEDQRAVSAAMLSVLDKAGYDVLFPREMGSLCCGLTFESKGFPELADQKSAELERELVERSDGGKIPILCDTSPCIQRMRAHFPPELKVYEPAEFIHAFLMDKLTFEKKAGTVAVHVTCSTSKLGLGPKLEAVAKACAEKVVVPPTGCCAFAGDRGFEVPELNASALRDLREQVKGCEAGYSNSRGCEIGLSQHGGIPYQSIVYLVDRCTLPTHPRGSP